MGRFILARSRRHGLRHSSAKLLRAWALCPCLVALAALGACTDSGAAGVDGVERLFAPSGPGGSASLGGAPILDQMEGVQNRTAFRGVRRVVDTQGGERLEQLEDVGADGSGLFAIELSQLVTVPIGMDSFSYEILFESSGRFLWTMRDFQVRNAAQAASNYAITLTPDTPVVAGIPCVRLSFLRNTDFGGRPGHYEADVDPATGFVLAWREFDRTGAVTTEVAYETFAYDGDVSDMTLRGRKFAASSLNLHAPLEAQAGFTTRLPDVLLGDMLYSTAEVQTVPASMVSSLAPGEESYLPVGRWLRLVASDGIEALVFAHSERIPTTVAPPGELKVYEHGSWEIGFGKINGTSFVVAGRGTLDQLRQIVGSAF